MSASKPIDRKLFDIENFNPIDYINTRFPDEQSLYELDSEIDSLKKEIEVMNKELIDDIHQHAVLNNQLQREIVDTNHQVKEIVKEIKDIQNKAESAESLVQEICKDIQQLDIAKKNLTFSITALKKYTMMVTAVDKLRQSCQKRKYKDISHLSQALDELFLYFKQFEQIPQIKEMFKEREDLIKGLKKQLIEDFNLFVKGNSMLTPEEMKEACIVVEAIGCSFKNEIVQNIKKSVIDPYEEIFKQKENKSIEQTERRYGWLWRTLKEFDQKNLGVFPEYWGIQCMIVHLYCEVTRIQTAEALELVKSNEVNVLMKSLEVTLKFENKITEEMQTRFGQVVQGTSLTEHEKQFAIDQIPKLKGSISDVFEPYLSPYIENEEQNIKEKVLKNQSDEVEQSDKVKVFISSFYMFNYIKNMIIRASKYSRTQVMYDIYKLIKRTLKSYAEQLEQRPKILKDQDDHITLICYIINTAEYCKETLPSMEEILKNSLDSPFNNDVDLSNEEDFFNKVVNVSIETLIKFVKLKVEPLFLKMSKIPWDRNDPSGDASEYVKETKLVLNSQFPKVKANISETYLIFYLNKLAVLINTMFISSVYELKKVQEGGLNQLLLDFYNLKIEIENLGKLHKDAKQLQNFTNYINKIMTKTENIIKLLQMNKEKFGDSFKIFFEDATYNDFKRLVQMRAFREEDYPELRKLLLSKQPPQ